MNNDIIDVNIVKSMIEDGFAKTKIAYHLQLSSGRKLDEIIDNSNFKMIKEIFDESKIDRIKDLYARGVSAKSLGIKFSIDKRRIQKWCKDDLRDKNDTHSVVDYDKHIFDEIDTPAKAYWLGFLYADAYNKEGERLTLSLAADDYAHVCKFAKFINCPQFRVIVGTNGKYKNSDELKKAAVIRVNGEHFSNTLAKHGCKQAKSLTATYPVWLREDLHSHYLRGLFDGDGSIKYNFSSGLKEFGFSLCATLYSCKDIQDVFLKNTGSMIQYSQHSTKSGIDLVIFDSNGNEKIRKIMDWLYKDATIDIVLERKYLRYLDLIVKQNSRTSHAANEMFFSTANINKHDIVKDNLPQGKKKEKYLVDYSRVMNNICEKTDIKYNTSIEESTKSVNENKIILNTAVDNIDISEVARLFSIGATVKTIALKMNTTFSNINKIIKDNNMQRPTIQFKTGDELTIVSAIDEGASPCILADIYNFGPSSKVKSIYKKYKNAN